MLCLEYESDYSCIAFKKNGKLYSHLTRLTGLKLYLPHLLCKFQMFGFLIFFIQIKHCPLVGQKNINILCTLNCEIVSNIWMNIGAKMCIFEPVEVT